jgi:hypothetical protein
MGELSQNKNLILIEEENENNQNEMNIEKYVERVGRGNVQIENYIIEENVEQIMKKNCKHYTFKGKIGKSIIKLFYVRDFIM